MVDTIVLDNGKEYFIVDKKVIDGTEYILFANMEDENDICFRKTTVKDGEKYFSYLKDDNEYNKVTLAFAKKYLRDK